MAPSPSPPKGGAKPGKPGAKPGKGGKLGKKVGPLPLWAWLAVGAGGAFLLYLYLRRGTGEGGGYGVETVTGSGGTPAYSPQQAAGAGAPSENGSLAGQLSPETQAAMEALGLQIGDVRGHVTELEDAFTSSGYSLNEDKTWTPPPFASADDYISDLVVGTTLGPPGAAPQKNSGQVKGGVRWGGQTFTTKRGLAGYLARTGGGPRDPQRAYQQWATRHKTAAKKLAGPPPKAKPKKAPARSQPKATKPKVKVQPKAQRAQRKPPAKGRR